MPSVATTAARIRRDGQPVTFTSADGTNTATVQAFVRGYAPSQLVGDIRQGDRVLRVAPADLTAEGWPNAPRRPDRVSINGAVATVQNVETVALRGVPAVYVVQVRGG